MGAMVGRRLAGLAAACVVAVASAGTLTACGSDQPDADQIAQIKADARREAAADLRSRAAVRETQRLRRELNRLKDGGGRSSGSGQATAPPSSSSGGSSGGSSSCGDGLSVNSVTSCPFAQNVRSAYASSGGSSSIEVYSPVTDTTYRMSCGGSVPVICTGGNGAAVYIR